MSILVSIIIPVYNVEPYIRQCIESVMAQTMSKGVECIIVDDCGQDNSIAIAEEMIAEYQGPIQFSIIHHEQNKGLSGARNTGIRAAQGEWLYFLDSDDWIREDCIKVLFDASKWGKSVEMVVGNYASTESIYTPPLELETGVYHDAFLPYSSAKLYMMAWNKLIRRDFLLTNSLFFKEGIIHEDDLWSFCCCTKLKEFVVLNENTLNYRIRETSIAQSSDFEKHHYGYGECAKGMIKYVLEHGENKNSKVELFILKQFGSLICSAIHYNKPKLAYEFYRSLINVPFWSLKEILFLPHKGHLLTFYFRRLFSLKYIYPLFIRFYMKRYNMSIGWIIRYDGV